MPPLAAPDTAALPPRQAPDTSAEYTSRRPDSGAAASLLNRRLPAARGRRPPPARHSCEHLRVSGWLPAVMGCVLVSHAGWCARCPAGALGIVIAETVASFDFGSRRTPATRTNRSGDHRGASREGCRGGPPEAWLRRAALPGLLAAGLAIAAIATMAGGLRLVLRLSVVAAASTLAILMVGWQPAALAVLTGALTWLAVTGSSDLAPPTTGRRRS
jgi:hypothetical protein